ncbi:hypothetical protein CPC08DRAFT_368697 [Agrocybe pediades]|nr:hypothetical protein CPC08DRAFT_368697 [Agrocybe pediades]
MPPSPFPIPCIVTDIVAFTPLCSRYFATTCPSLSASRAVLVVVTIVGSRPRLSLALSSGCRPDVWTISSWRPVLATPVRRRPDVVVLASHPRPCVPPVAVLVRPSLVSPLCTRRRSRPLLTLTLHPPLLSVGGGG